MELKVKRLKPNAILPTRANPGDLGFDLFTLETVAVPTGQTVAIPTAIACEFPSGWGAFIKARSSQGKKGIDVFGGVVDEGYRGELIVLLHNSNEYIPNTDNVIIYSAGDKVAQLVLVPVFPGDVQEVTTLDESQRGERGFGSSGK